MKRICDLINDAGITVPLPLNGCPVRLRCRNRVNVIALGDVGATMLIGLRLLGSDVVSDIGICDIRPEACRRLEMEINQIRYPFEGPELPGVHIIEPDDLFDCDVLIFCASRGVPEVRKSSEADRDDGPTDVRMAQLEANRGIIKTYAGMARDKGFKGLVAVVSDPVDNLAAAFLDESGLDAWQFQGYGLGVMNARAMYYAERDSVFASYITEGRVYGPHGQDLVAANSLTSYDPELSDALTALARDANLEIRKLGYKPYIAPAVSSAALSILLTLRGEWHYGSIYLGSREDGAFMGIKNRLTEDGWEYEDADLPDELYDRIRRAYNGLRSIR